MYDEHTRAAPVNQPAALSSLERESHRMKILQRTGFVLVTALALTPLQSFGQVESYHHAKRQQHRSDARHHTKAKIVGGSAAGGAVVGGLLGGGKGALIGAGVGAGGGLIANHQREKNDVRKRQEYGTVHP